MTTITPELLEQARKIKAVIFDGDGVFFTGRVFVGKEGEILKERSHIDGQGISMLRSAGIRIAIITNEATGMLEKITEKLNSLPSVLDGKWPLIKLFTGKIAKNKVASAEEWLNEIGLTFEQCAYMGDDIGDYKIMEKVGFPTAPAQAENLIKMISKYIAPREGGNGAIRDLCNLILDVQGIELLKLDLK